MLKRGGEDFSVIFSKLSSHSSSFLERNFHEKLFGLVITLLLTACSTPEKVASMPDVANFEGVWRSSLLTTEACDEQYIDDNAEVTFDFSQKDNFLSATVLKKNEVAGGTSVHGGTFIGNINPGGSINETEC